MCKIAATARSALIAALLLALVAIAVVLLIKEPRQLKYSELLSNYGSPTLEADIINVCRLTGADALFNTQSLCVHNYRIWDSDASENKAPCLIFTTSSELLITIDDITEGIFSSVSGTQTFTYGSDILLIVATKTESGNYRIQEYGVHHITFVR